MVKEITYTLPNGKKALACYADRGSVYTLAPQREKFAQLCAQGELPLDAYCRAYDVELKPDTVQNAKDRVKYLLSDTTVVLRIQELKRPVLRKLAKKIEYNLQKALEQCQVAYDLAYADGDSKGILAAVRMQAELGKLLSQDINVNHRHGLLDDASTEVLLEMRKQIEVRQAKAKRLPIVVGGNAESSSPTP